ncbi:MAG: hypothetical protein R3C53_21120 [Pirellulaceae bacterium]
MKTRREKIEAMLVDEPQDIFLRYTLSLELHGEGQTNRALSLLLDLTRESPPLCPCLFPYAQILAENDQIEESRGFLRDGIETARQQGDLHAASEMSEMLADLGQM